MRKSGRHLAALLLLAATFQQAAAQDKTVYRCPGPPVIYTDEITPGEAATRLCREVGVNRWVEVTRNDASVVFLDNETVSRSGRVLRVWLKREYGKPIPASTEKGKSYFLVKELTLLNCDERSVLNLQQLRYANTSGTGTPVETIMTPETTGRFRPLIPESFEERILTAVCLAHRR